MPFQQSPRRPLHRSYVAYILLRIDRWTQPHLMTKPRNRPTPIMGAATSLHRNDAVRVAFHKLIKLSPRQLFAKHDRSIPSSAVQMKNPLGQVDPYQRNIFHGYLPRCLVILYHSGTKRCRRAGVPLHKRLSTWGNRGSESPRQQARMLAVGCSPIRWKYGLTTGCRAQASNGEQPWKTISALTCP